MKIFKYKAMNNKGEIIKSEFQGESKIELINFVKNSQKVLLKYSEDNIFNLFFKRKLNVKNTYMFSRQLGEMLINKINLIDALYILKESPISKENKQNVDILIDEIERGTPFTLAIEKVKYPFQDLMVSMIDCSDENGNLGEVLINVYEYYQKEHEIMGKIKKALFYPIMVLGFSIVIFWAMLVFVVPSLEETILSLQAKISLTARIIFALSNLLRNPISSMIINIVIITFMITLCLNRKKVIEGFKRVIIKINYFKYLYISLVQIKLSKALSLLISSGENTYLALKTCECVLGDEFIKERYSEALEKIKNGNKISKSLEECNVFTKFFTSILNIGEESGTIKNMLVSATSIMEKEYSDNLDRMIEFIKPIFIVILSFLVGGIMFSLLSPMFTIMEGI